MRVLRRLLVSLPLIVVVALGVRSGFAWHEGRQLPANLRGTVPFLQEAGNIARSLASDKGFSDVFGQGTGATAWLTPVYPLLLAAIFRVFGIFGVKSFIAAVALNIGCSAATCVPIFFAGRKMAGVGVGATAAWFWAIFPNAVMIPYEWIWDTSLTVLLAALILWFTLKLAESPRAHDWWLYGLLWGFTLMTNPALATLLPFLLGWAAYHNSLPGRGKLALVALVLLIVVLSCTPWTVRNYVAFHRFVPLRSTFPFALWLGHNRVFDPRSPVTTRVTPYEEGREYKQLGETAFMRKKWTEALNFIQAHPVVEMSLFERRFVAFWFGLEDPFRQFRDAESPGDRLLLLANFLAALGTLSGLFVVWIKRRQYALVVSAFPLVFPWIYYATQPYLRYRQPIDPVLMLLSAMALDALLHRFQTKPARGAGGDTSDRLL